MAKRVFIALCIGFICMVCLQTYTFAQTSDTKDPSLKLIRIGVLAFRPKPQTLEQWRPMADILNQAIPTHHFVIEALTYPEMNDAIKRKQLDFVLTNSGNYILLKRHYGLSSALATLSVDESGYKVNQFAGVIFARASNTALSDLASLKHRRIAATDIESLGGYQMQAYELYKQGIDIPKDTTLLITGMPHDNVVQMVLDGRADAGFIRTGVLEKMASENKLSLREIRIINAQTQPWFPVARSTRLYPEWPLSALPHVEESLARAVVSSLFRLENNSPLARLMHIYGFNIPVDYTIVEDMLRELRFPPFDTQPLFELSDVWEKYKLAIFGLSLMTIVALLVLLIYLMRNNRLLKTQHTLYEELSSHTRTMHWEVNKKGLYTYVSPNVKELLGYEVDEVVGKRYFYELRPEEDRTSLRERVFAIFMSQQSYHNTEGRMLTKKGEIFWIRTYGFPIFDAYGELKGYRGSNTDMTAEKQAMDALKESEARFKALHNASFGGIAIHDKGLILECNQGLATMSGYRIDELIGMNGLLLIAESTRALVLENIQQGYEKPYTALGLRKDGTEFPIRLEAREIPYRGKMVRAVEFRDITEEKKAQEKLLLAASVFTAAREGILITDQTGIIMDVNNAFTRITGYTKEEVIGQTPRILNSGHHDQSFYEQMWHELTCKDHWYGEIWNRRKNGEVYPEMLTITALRHEEGDVKHYVALFSDISALKAHQAQLEHIAHHDALTGLPNRLLLADRLHQGMVQSKRRNERLAVAYLDLDGFKQINDQYGHEIGDKLLIALSAQMKQALRQGDTLARLGGDEFVAVLHDIKTEDSSLVMLKRLLEATAKPVALEHVIVNVSASLGVTFYPQHEEIEADGLLRQADQAMYQAKLAGKNRYHLFDSQHDATVRTHHEHLESIRLGLYRDEFELFFQPKVNMLTGALLGVEALIRWNHPSKGLLSPNAFLPFVENHALSVDIGEWVIQEALRHIAIWDSEGVIIPVSVNVGARQLQERDFATRLRSILERFEFSASLLELEILETSALEDLEYISNLIHECKAFGVMFALDDFGTGYSSLTYLKQLPVSLLKIDQSFVRDMLDDPDDLAILEGVIGLANAFHKDVIAEGVESAQHCKALLELGCVLGQGYGIARPMPASEVLAWLKQWQHDKPWLYFTQA